MEPERHPDESAAPASEPVEPRPVEADDADAATAEPDSTPEAGSQEPMDAGRAGDDVADRRSAHEGPIAVLTGVIHDYNGQRALGPLDLTIDGRCVGLLGPNGAGKSTLIRILLGLLTPSGGHATVLGQAAGPAVRSRIGYAPEGEAAFPELSGVEAVAYAGELSGMSRADAMQRAHQVLDYVGLDDARYRLSSGYSTGMRQRLKIAQALVHDPQLLILDEPTEGVDPQARDDLLELIDELSRIHGIRILITTHLLADVERLATHAILLDNGAVVAQGELDALQSQNASGHVVRVAGDPGPLCARLDDHGVAWRNAEPAIQVELDSAKDVLAHVAAAGLTVRHLAPMKLRLDEAFEQAVGGAHA